MANAATQNTVIEVAAQVRAILVDRFPKCFQPKGAAKLPLAIGVGADLERALPDISWRHLHWALSDYAHGPLYLRQITPNAPRFDLDGSVRGEVLPSEAEYAASLLSKMARPKSAVQQPVAETAAA